MIVVDRRSDTGITVVEALEPGAGVGISSHREYTLHPGAVPPGPVKVMEEVVERAREFRAAPYTEPPLRLDGDPLETRIYCSMLPYRAYLDAAGIDLDGYFPFAITPMSWLRRNIP